MGVLPQLCGLFLHMCLCSLAASIPLSHARASPRLWADWSLRPGPAFGPGSVGAPAEALRRVLLGAKATHQRVRPELRLLVCTAEYFGLLPHWMPRSGRRADHAHTQFLEPLPWEIVESGFSWGASPCPNLSAGEGSTLAKEQGHAPHAADVEANTAWTKAEEQLARHPSINQQEAHSPVERVDAEGLTSHVSVGSPAFVLQVLEEASRAAWATWQEGVAAAVAAAAHTPAPAALNQEPEREPSLPRVALEAARAALRAASRALWRARLRRGDEAAAGAAPAPGAEARVAALRAALRAWSRSPSGRAAQWLLRQLMADPLMRCARAYATARLWQWAGA